MNSALYLLTHLSTDHHFNCTSVKSAGEYHHMVQFILYIASGSKVKVVTLAV